MNAPSIRTRAHHTMWAPGRAARVLGVMAAGVVVSGVAFARPAHAPLEVRVTGGLVRGTFEHGVIAFKGIPYAAPPVGALRWEPPQPIKPWRGVRAAVQFGPDCMQRPTPGDMAPLRTRPAENCLYVNVWRPRSAAARKLPVMVWVYGGGFVDGGTSPAVYDGSQFARDGVVLVSFNYRVGNFGFFAFPALLRQAHGAPVGDYTFMDQIAALKWVRRNIAAFGGNPHNVTLFGQSAGGMSVNALIATPLARGLFQKAIVESGGGGAGLLKRRALASGPGSAEQMGVRLARHFGIHGEGTNALAALRAIPATRLVDGLNMATLGRDRTYVGGPIIDDRLYFGPAETVYAEGKGARIPVMIGATSADLGTVRARSKRALFAKFGPDAAAARAVFDPSGRFSLHRVEREVGGAVHMIEPARAIARTLSARGQPVYEYRFGYVATSLRKSSWGAAHATEIPFAFDTVRAHYGSKTSRADEILAREMHAYWVAFAKTGKPDPAGLPAWPAYHAHSDRLMDFTEHGPVAQTDPWQQRLNLVEKYLQRNAPR